MKIQKLLLTKKDKYFSDESTLQHLGLGYIASILEDNKYEVFYIEMQLLSMTISDIIKIIKKNKISMVGISTYYYNLKNLVKIIGTIKSSCPDVFIFAGDYLATLSSQMLLLKLPIHCCVIGEGEITVLELCNVLRDNNDWRNINGIAYKNIKDNEIIFTKNRQVIKNLDILPFPKRIFVPRFSEVASVLSGRGCYGKCTYCAIDAFYCKNDGISIRRRSPEKAVEEIQRLINNYNVKRIKFNDDNFSISSQTDKKWFNEFYKMIKEKNINVRFWCTLRANEVILADDILKKFVEVSLDDINIGIESLVQTQLDFFNKKVTVSQNMQALKIISDFEIHFSFGILIFDPRTKIDEIIIFLNNIKKMEFISNSFCNPSSINCFVIAMEGTAIRRYVNDNNLYNDNERYYNFKETNTEICYSIINKWANKIKFVLDYRYLVSAAEDTNNPNILRLVQDLYKKLFILDLNVLEKICKLSKEEKNINFIEEIIDSNGYNLQLQELIDETIEINNNIINI